MFEPEWAFVSRPFREGEPCGDAGVIRKLDRARFFLAVIDALGHGRGAHETAETCRIFLEKHAAPELPATIRALNGHIRGLRGAAAGLCLVDTEAGELTYAAMGDIHARKFGTKGNSMISRPGIIGYQISTPTAETTAMTDRDVLVMYTDGIKSVFDLEDLSRLEEKSAETIARAILERFTKGNDDAACLVFKSRGRRR